jgi:hypothetical protein
LITFHLPENVIKAAARRILVLWRGVQLCAALHAYLDTWAERA